MVIQKDRRNYLENPVGTLSTHSEVLDGHGESRVLSITHVCKSAVVVNPPGTNKLCTEKIRGGDDSAGLADLGEKQQTPTPEFIIQIRSREHLFDGLSCWGAAWLVFSPCQENQQVSELRLLASS